ncbi:hypothetical protein JYT20_01765 [Rhodothermus sp. AH-315-K08]|nr:hypothetical protein [Rhodothermus sp. AH-315-K08]
MFQEKRSLLAFFCLLLLGGLAMSQGAMGQDVKAPVRTSTDSTNQRLHDANGAGTVPFSLAENSRSKESVIEIGGVESVASGVTISQEFTNSSVFAGGGQSYGQSFQATLTGTVTTIELPFLATGFGAFSGAIKLLSGEGLAGQVLATQSISAIGTGSWVSITFATPPAVIAGDQYTLALFITDGFAHLPFSNTNVYAAGRMHLGVTDFSGSDLMFRIHEVAPNQAPNLAGTSAGQAVNDNATLTPFSAVTVTDADGDNVSATITLDTNAKGVLTGTGLSGLGPYTLASASAASLQATLRALTFNPTDNRVATGTETTTFTLVVNDGTVNATDNTTTVVSSPVAPSGYTVSIDQEPINAGNKAAVGFTFAGAEVGATYNYIFSDGSSGKSAGANVIGSGTIGSGGHHITGVDLSAQADGTTTLSVTLTDSGGAVGAATTDTSTRDTAAPTIAISVIAGDDIINATEDNSSVTISGTTSGAENGRTVTVALNAKTYTGAGGRARWPNGDRGPQWDQLHGHRRLERMERHRASRRRAGAGRHREYDRRRL